MAGYNMKKEVKADTRLINAVNMICQKYLFDGIIEDKDKWVKITVELAEYRIMRAVTSGASSEAITTAWKILDVWKEYYQTI